MGKASRWIRNLLIGKKEEKVSNKDGGATTSPLGTTTIVPSSPLCTTTTIVPSSPPCTTIATASPSQRRRWSFRRSSNTEKLVNHKSCRSFDSIITSQSVSQALFDYAVQYQDLTTTLVVPPPKATLKTPYRVSHMVALAAATKIQASFRSYLARKALCALRGLVKLQALVRGHLVRKQTVTMVRCMNALVAIQVRARFQRIQMAEDAELWSHLGATSKRGSVMAHMRRPSAPHDEPNYMTWTKSSRAKARSQSEPRQRPTTIKRTSSNEGLTAITKVDRTHDHQKNRDGWSTKLHRPSSSIKDFEFDLGSTCTNGSTHCTTFYAYKPVANLY